MSTPADKLPGFSSIALQTARLFSQTGTSIRDNAQTPGWDPKMSMGLQFADSASALPGMLNKSFMKLNVVSSIAQGGYDVVQGMRKQDDARTGSGVLSLGFVAVSAVSAPASLVGGTAFAVANLVAPEQTKVALQVVGRSTNQLGQDFVAYMSKPVDPSTERLMRNLG